MAGQRRSGGEIVQRVELRGDPELARALAEALGASEGGERHTHGFHTYPAGLHPDAARDLLRCYPGDVLDPFCGGGTVLVEGRLDGRRVVGRDLSAIAVLVARGRTASVSDARLTRLRSTARRLTAAARPGDSLPPDELFEMLGDWYDPHALAELYSLHCGIEESEPDLRGSSFWSSLRS